MNFDPRSYWEDRLKKYCSLEGVGWQGRSLNWNYFFYKTKVRAMNRALNKLGLDIKGYKALDVGTGIGFWIDYLLEKKVKFITGVDISLSAIEFCKRKYSNFKNIEFFCGDISDDTFVSEKLNKKYDLVTAFDVLYHITNDDKFKKTIKNIANVLNPGGYLFLTDILSSREIESQQEHVRWRSLDFYKEELNKNKLDIIYLAPMTVFFGSPIDASGLLGKILYYLYYGITVPLTLKSKKIPGIIEKSYLTLLYKLDTLLSLSPRFGVSTKILVAKKRDW